VSANKPRRAYSSKKKRILKSLSINDEIGKISIIAENTSNSWV